MAKKDRKKKLWHIPKRGNVHQAIFMVHTLAGSEFNERSWNTQKQERLSTEMGKAGLTSSGKALTHQSIRTLLANIPQYLGFVGKKDQNGTEVLFVTKAGKQLTEEFPIEKVVSFQNTGRSSNFSLDSYVNAGFDIRESETFKQQMTKLIITNPNLSSDCVEILLFPFLFTLRVLKEVGYLDIQEIAYILFHAPSETHLPSTVARINNFRKLSKDLREYEIKEYCKTEEGQLTLVKAATANYFCLLCESTGLCKRETKFIDNLGKSLTALEIKNPEEVEKILRKYNGIEAFDFKDDSYLWYEYFGDPRNEFPPFYTTAEMEIPQECLISVTSEAGIVFSDLLTHANKFRFVFPVFLDAAYQIDCYDSTTGEQLISQNFCGDKKVKSIKLKGNTQVAESTQATSEKISELLERNKLPFDKSYNQKLSLILEHFGENYFHNIYRGGRLEYLFFDILKKLQEKGIIDDVQWNGKIQKYGIAIAAPGKASGEPDIIFKVSSKTYILELTTIGSTTLQWSAEGSSVPDHVEKYVSTHPEEQVEGIFSAPAIYPRNKEHLIRGLEKTGVKINFIDCNSFAKSLESFTTKEDFISYFKEI